MKKVIISLVLVLSCTAAVAQMTRWAIQPEYDRIYIAPGAPLLISDSLNASQIWSMDGKRLAETQDFIHPFKEGLAVTTQKDSENITGFFNERGEFTALKNCSVSYDEPFFRDGYLLVKSGDDYYCVNNKGEVELYNLYEKIYPFNNGFATCLTYEQLDKFKNPYYTYITVDKEPIMFSYQNKIFEDKDVEFLSSVNDEGIGVAIIKHKVYLFDKDTRKIEPVFANKSETNLKRQVVVAGESNEYLVETKDSIMISGKGSKTEYVEFVFDKFLRPTAIRYSDRTEEYKAKKVDVEKYSSHFSSIKLGDKYGLNYKDTNVLPAQFEEIGFCVNDYAVVRSNGKWGMLTYDQDLKYKLIMHNGKDIAFRHKDVATSIKLELPITISADKCRFDVDEKYGCKIDKISLDTKNTENGNYVQYNCTLTIPDSLPDVITEIQYPVQITYDGIKHPVVPIKTKAWHYKYINVDLDDTETSVMQGDVSFTIKISADKQPGENDYPFEVEIKTDSLRTENVKITETRYKCKLYALAEGVNNVNIYISEDGCPPSVFPFEITYTKPVEETKDQPEVKETAVIRKIVKVKEPAKPKGPRLPILTLSEY